MSAAFIRHHLIASLPPRPLEGHGAPEDFSSIIGEQPEADDGSKMESDNKSPPPLQHQLLSQHSDGLPQRGPLMK